MDLHKILYENHEVADYVQGYVFKEKDEPILDTIECYGTIYSLSKTSAEDYISELKHIDLKQITKYEFLKISVEFVEINLDTLIKRVILLKDLSQDMYDYVASQEGI